MSSGRKRGRPKRKAQRRAKWQHEQRFTKRTKRQTPLLVRDEEVAVIREVTFASHMLTPRVLREDDYIVFANDRVPDGHPLSPYRDGRERLL